jgi:hypothetical protein
MRIDGENGNVVSRIGLVPLCSFSPALLFLFFNFVLLLHFIPILSMFDFCVPIDVLLLFVIE